MGASNAATSLMGGCARPRIDSRRRHGRGAHCALLARPTVKGEVSMRISNIIDRKGGEVVTINSQANLKAAANVMHDRRIAALVVLSDRKVVGVVSERDIVSALAQNGPSAGGSPLKKKLW